MNVVFMVFSTMVTLYIQAREIIIRECSLHKIFLQIFFQYLKRIGKVQESRW